MGKEKKKKGSRGTFVVGKKKKKTYKRAITIKQRTSDHAYEELQKRRQGADPGDIVRRVVSKLVAQIVLGKGTKGVGEAQAAEEDGGGSEGDEPCPEATVGCRLQLRLGQGLALCRAGLVVCGQRFLFV
jgi:hypothetical protein